MIRPGYIYVLTHPSDENLYKVGVTILDPVKRLAQHNADFSKAAGRIVEQTNQKWELKEFHSVPDPYWAEKAFWSAVPQSDIPYRGGVEVETMTWAEVQAGLKAAKSAGNRTQELPDYAYSNTASVTKKLEGRGITLVGYVKSINAGKNNFQCSNGHEWRTTLKFVVNGKGCPKCGVGTRTPKEMREGTNAGIVCLLTNPNKAGFIKIGAQLGTMSDLSDEYPWGDWEVERYRNVEDVVVAELVIWELLGKPLPHNLEPIEIDLEKAKDAFRSLIYVVRERMAIEEKKKLEA